MGSQRLLPAARAGIVLSAEVLITSARVRDMVVGGAAPADLLKAISEGGYYGMNTFDQRLVTLVRDGVVKEADALDYASDAHDFKLLLERAGGAPVAAAVGPPVGAPAMMSFQAGVGRRRTR